MRQLLLLLLAFILLVSPVWAQNDDAAMYVVTDVAADVTADSAAHARDQAVVQAQRSAFEQLLDRFGADTAIAAKLSDDDLSTLVQSFEVQNERSSSVHYIGTFTVQFRPGAVRGFLGNHGAPVMITRSKPMVILPVVSTDGHRVLWEEPTKWRTAWESASHGGGLVPLTIPVGDLDDVTVLGTDEAVSGKAASLKAMIAKYQAGGAVVVTLNQSAATPAPPMKVDMQRYDSEGAPVGAAAHFTLTQGTEPNAADAALTQGIHQARAELEKDWRQEVRNAAKNTAGELQPATDTDAQASGPLATLPVAIPIANLSAWAQIRHELQDIPAIRRVNVIALERGASNVELSFTGDVDALRTSLLEHNLSLTQNGLNGGWILRTAIPGDTP